MYRRVVLIVLDGVGVGALPDAERYGDVDAATLPHVAMAVGGLALPHLQALGLGNIVPIAGVAPVSVPQGYWGKMAERSPGKDSVIGHWELAGVVSQRPFAVYPQGFPAAIIDSFTAVTGKNPSATLPRAEPISYDSWARSICSLVGRLSTLVVIRFFRLQPMSRLSHQHSFIRYVSR